VTAAAHIAALREISGGMYRTLDERSDDPAVKLFNRRTAIIAAIEMRSGSLFDATEGQTELLDNCEEAMRFVEASTLQGILAKLWFALGHLSPAPADARTEGERQDRLAAHAATMRADTDEIATVAKDWDVGEELVFGAIRDIERALQFERVGLKGDSLVPMGRAA
jgi:hypothetical protein